jgi:pimeloyl-ACP methyl ester carboxylesterase
MHAGHAQVGQEPLRRRRGRAVTADRAIPLWAVSRVRPVVVAVLLAAGLATGPVRPASADPTTCRPLHVPAPHAGAADASIFGVLCLPSPSARPATVQLLVHGGTYNHQYWDWPIRPEQYSYVRRALAAGYAVMNVDRLGYGRSTHPPSALVSLANGAAALHDVITSLRSGELAGFPFTNVVYVGHSVGSIVGWLEASTYRDVSAFVVTGMTHHLKQSAVAAISQAFYPARCDPAFQHSDLDPGYVTTKPGKRDRFFFSPPYSEPDVVAYDEKTKDTLAGTEAAESLSLILSPPPEAAPARAIAAPTLVVIGAADIPFCGAPDGPDCHDPAANRAAEAPYYGPEARLEVFSVRENGHNLQLHRSAPVAADRILEWIRRTVA